MTKTNTARVVLGGILSGLVLNILGFLVDGVLLAPHWRCRYERTGQKRRDYR